MILVDTSVWVEHLRRGSASLAASLEAGGVLCHPFVIGELACGRLHARTEVLALLAALPQATLASDAEVMGFVDRHAIFGRGIGWVDAHLLAAAALSDATLWTLDKRLATVTRSLGLAGR